MIDAARQMGARVLMYVEPAKGSGLAGFYLRGGFRVCGMNDRWFACGKDSTAVFYACDL